MGLFAMDHLYPAPQDGKPGDDAVVYSIVCSNTNPNVTDSDVSVTLTAYKTVGTERELCTFDGHLCFGNATEGQYINDNPATVVMPKGSTKAVIIELIDEDVLAVCTISPVVNGVNGTSVLAQYCPSRVIISIGGTSTKPDESNIHDSYKDGDEWMRTKSSADAAYGSWFRIVGEKGTDGEYTDYTFNLSKDKTTKDAYTVPGNLKSTTWTDAPQVPNTDYPYLWMRMERKNLPAFTAILYEQKYTYVRLTGEDGKTVTAQYSVDGKTNWHSPFAKGDIWMRTSEDGGSTWGAAVRMVGEKGDGGAWTDYRFNISSALTTSSPLTAPTPLGRSSWEDAPMATTSSFPYLWMQVQKYSDTDTIDGKATYVRLTGQEGQNGESFSRIVDEYQALAQQDPSRLDSTAWKSDVSATSYSADYPYLYKRETVYALDKAGAEYAKSRTVPHLSAVWGSVGRIGPIGYPAGIWDSATTYKSSDDATPIVYHKNSYWYKVSTTDSTNEEPSADSKAWKLAPNFSVMMVEILMASFGKIASAVFSGDFMMSQYGLNNKNELTNDYKGFDGDPTPYIGNGFAPNICFDMLNGEAWLNKAHIRGEVDAGSINVEYKDLTDSDATVVSEKEYTLNNDLNINVDVSGGVVINLPTSKTYIGKHVYILSNTGPFTRVIDWSVVIASATGIFASGSSDLTNLRGGYKSITYVGGVIHLMGLPNAFGCVWGVMSEAVNSINYNS